MTAPTGWLPAPVEELFGTDATAEESYEVLTVDVPAASWLTALETARTTLTCTYFDWLSAVDEPGTGFRVSAHVVALAPVRRLLLRTTVPHATPELPSAVGVYAGARWHERETHEMFGVRFTGHPGLDHLLLPETFEGHPLRKDFVLAARVAKAWPGAKEPGESDHGGPRRRQMLPPGVPDPNEWGPLKGQLPPAPARPARAAAGRAAGERPARAAAAAAAAGDRPVRRTRTAAEGSVGQAPAAAESAEGAQPTAAPARRARSTSEGSATQRTAPGDQPPAAPRRARSAGEGSASQREASPAEETAPQEEPSAAPRGPRRARTASGGSASQRAQETAHTAPPTEPATPATPQGTPATPQGTGVGPSAPRGSDAPWHHARPAFGEPEAGDRPGTATPEPTETDEAAPASEESGPASDDAAPTSNESGPASDESGPTSEEPRPAPDDSDADPGQPSVPRDDHRPGGPQ
ncbi:NADH-quinone oxidoreductase subunit C [Streptomyces sp. NPDC048282]|uniref:NADH-quinone oxidoreductase subunit C n=1 Tax=Streptomyces sp. NPDC048282 TaxID=3365528 RepID=UPI00371EE991